MGGTSSERAWRILWGLLAGQRARLGLALLATLLASLCEFLPFVLLARSVAVLLDGAQVPQRLLGLAGSLALVIVLKLGLYSLAYYLSHVAAYRLLLRIRHRLVRQLCRAPLPWLSRHSSAQFKQWLVQDVERLEQFIAHHSVECLAALLTPLWVLIALCQVDGRLALCALAPAPLALLAQAWMMRNLGPRLGAFAGANQELQGATVEYLRAAPLMKAFAQDSLSSRRMRSALARYRQLIGRMIRLCVPGWALFTVVLGAGSALLLPVGTWLWHSGQLRLDQLVLGVLLGSALLRPLQRVAPVQSQWQEILAGVRRFAPLLAWPEPLGQAPELPAQLSAEPTLRLENVVFAYDGHAVLRDLNLTLAPGSMTALVGPSGSGKSTLALLAAGLLAPDSGQVSLGGQPLAAFDGASRAAAIGVVTQDPLLFRGSLRDNLRLGATQASEAQVYAALRVAQAEDFVRALPQGLDTRLDERGLRLSGGERQRIAVARALLQNTPLLILDEATAFADSRTERRFYQALRLAYPKTTLLVVAHRLASVSSAEHIVVLDAGRILDQGPHALLRRRCALYANQWQRQFDSQAWSLRNGSDAHAFDQ